MKNSEYVNYMGLLILSFMIVMILATAKLSPSYAMTIINNQVNTGPSQDKVKQIVDNNAFSDLSRNMTSSTKDNGQSFASNITDTTSSKSPTFAADNGNSTNNIDGGSSR
jgi:hypothetical protein